ncbi:hypothetical protein [Micrococcus sp.]|uniref:hypothetical protein n=1 Tax=Micrococcus sp. TaxID=1271 RepID=UPI0026DB83BE|nr:hypothetical protein [Micrococcus sp.]MDO4239643.1 hypothetical protein [Micrococcus sp.]
MTAGMPGPARPPAPAPPFRTVGGPASVFADLDALEALAARRREQAADAMRLAGRARLLLDRIAPAVAVAPSAARLSVRLPEGEHACRALADRLEEAGRALARAAEGYRAAERGAAGVMDTRDLDVEGLRAWMLDAARDGVTASDTEFVLRQGADAVAEDLTARLLVDPVAAALSKAPYIGPLVTAARRSPWVDERLGEALTAALEWTADLVLDTPVGELADYPTVSHVLTAAADAVANAPVLAVEARPAPAPARLDGGLADLLSLVPGPDAPPGAVTVTAVVDPATGERTWVVGLPGTQGRDAAEDGTTNWADLFGIADAYAGGSARAGEGIAQALALAGVPEGAAVVLVGHSAGGMHAVNMTAHPAVTSRWRVGGAVTVGSPAGSLTPRAGTPVLSLQREADVMTGLDGGPNAASADWATVSMADTRPVGADDGAAELLWRALAQDPELQVRELFAAPERWADAVAGRGGEHSLEAYRAAAAAYEAADPALRSQEQGILDALSDLTAGDVRSSTHVTLRRQPLPTRADVVPPERVHP